MVMRQGITDEDVLLGLLAMKYRFVLYTVVGMTKRKSVKVLACNRGLVRQWCVCSSFYQRGVTMF